MMHHSGCNSFLADMLSPFDYTSMLETSKIYGRIIKWTQHIGFLTLAGMYPVIEGNRGKDLKEG